MDLRQLIQLLFAQDYGDGGGTGDDHFYDGQNRRLVIPELIPGEADYNQTPGNPPVTLDNGWLRSLVPHYTGEGGPPGYGQDDGKPRTLEDLMWMKNRGLMQQYQKGVGGGDYESYRNSILPQELQRRIYIYKSRRSM